MRLGYGRIQAKGLLELDDRVALPAGQLRKEPVKVVVCFRILRPRAVSPPPNSSTACLCGPGNPGYSRGCSGPRRSGAGSLSPPGTVRSTPAAVHLRPGRCRGCSAHRRSRASADRLLELGDRLVQLTGSLRGRSPGCCAPRRTPDSGEAPSPEPLRVTRSCGRARCRSWQPRLLSASQDAGFSFRFSWYERGVVVEHPSSETGERAEKQGRWRRGRRVQPADLRREMTPRG